MFSVYISSFVSGAAHTRELSSALRDVQNRLGARWKALLSAIPDLLEPAFAHEAIAHRMLDMSDPWTGLRSIGLRSPHAPGIMNEAHLAYVRMLQPKLFERSEMEKLIAWLKPDRQEAKVSGAGEAISALLGHWIDNAPAADDLRYLTENLVGLYGDPRVQRGGAWAAVPESHLAVVMRWLTGENIRFFLDVVSKVERSHMWEPRRNFWLGLHEQGRIDAAWVAFSDEGEIEARKRSESSNSRGTLRFGRQMAGGSRINTSLLILKIGRKIVVEGSHNYKVHIFDSSNKQAPALYQLEYDCEEIRTTPGAKDRSHIGHWEGWVLENV